MNHELKPLSPRQLGGLELQDRLLAELVDLFREIEDGTVKESTFTGCIALGHEGLPPLTDNQSRQIRHALLSAPPAAEDWEAPGIFILSSMFNLIRRLWGSGDAPAQPTQEDAGADNPLVDQYGRVKANNASPSDRPRIDHQQEIQEEDVSRFFAARRENYNWVPPYAWDIANRLNAVKKSETEGDLSLFLERRRRLNVRRPKATRFEQSAQRYAAKISDLYCSENGDITDAKSLEALINRLVDVLLDKTKAYWPTSPLLAIFDGLVATIMRPLIHKHQTAFVRGDTTDSTGVIISGQMTGKTEKLVTTPKWNEKSRQFVLDQVRKAFKAQVWSFFMDRYAPYNRDYARSPHVNAATLADVGSLVRRFGDPVHLGAIMELLQPTGQADELVRYVERLRSDDFVDH